MVPDGATQQVTLQVTGVDPDCGSPVSDTGLITIDNNCTDSNPSSITILTGQTVGGPAVDLTQIFTYTGDVHVNGFTYKVNGKIIGDPTAWDSREFGKTATEGVTFEVSGYDPGDAAGCGNRIVAVNTLLVDNNCVRNPPSISFADDNYYVGHGRAVPVDVTIRNEDSFNCGASTFTLSVASDSNLAFFNESGFGTDVASLTPTFQVSLEGHEATTINLTVSAKGDPNDPQATKDLSEWENNITTLEVTSSQGNVHKIYDEGPPESWSTVSSTIDTSIFLVSPITHNSVTTHSPKWGGSWGTSETGSKYGNFDCMVCHEKDSPNVKWMAEDVRLPTVDKTPEGRPESVITEGGVLQDPGSTLPNGSTEITVEFTDARSRDERNAEGIPGPSNWGDDFEGRTTSDKVCEVCHTTTMYHRFDTTIDTTTAEYENTPMPVAADGDFDHFNNRDCTDCHRHSLGFTADCTGCHGDPPLEPTLGGPNGLANIPNVTGSVTPGTHYKHTVVLGYECEYCHAGWRTPGEMPKEASNGMQDINHLFNIFSEREVGDPHPVIVDATITSQAHYTGQDGVSYETVIIPAGQGTMTCESLYCHGGANDYIIKPGDGTFPGGIIHPSNMGGSNPRWNGNITCNSCHGTSATNTPPGYSHTTHVGKMNLDCKICHYTPGDIEPGYNGHVNGHVELQMATPSWDGGDATYDPDTSTGPLPAVVSWYSNPDGTDLPPSTSYGTCLNVACHYGIETPPWNNLQGPDADGLFTSEPAQCTMCHNDGAGDTGVLTESAPNSGWHEEHVHPPANTIHDKMISGFVNGCESCHGGGANTGEHAGHVNFQVDLGGGLTYSDTSNTCTSQCHDLRGIDTKGTAVLGDDTAVAIDWMTHSADYVLACEACHAAPYIGPTVVDPDGELTGMASPDPDGFGSHLKETKTEDLSLVTSWTDQCRKCHPYHQDEGLTGIDVVSIKLPPTNWDYPWTDDGDPGTTTDVESEDMRGKLGLNYNVTTAVHLGGSATSGLTEADMCWNCHGADSEINEWGYNEDTTPTGTYPVVGIAPDTTNPTGHNYWAGGTGNPLAAAGGSFNYGYMYTSSDWTTGATSAWVESNGRGYFRRDGYQHSTETTVNYANSRRISSVHSGNFDLTAADASSVAMNVDLASGNVDRSTTNDNETPGEIRCTYCHDVHDMNRAVNLDGSNETATGRPFLRGTWAGNPYPPSRPPLDSYEQNNAYVTNRYEAGQGRGMPRLYSNSAGSKAKGGYFIDANSNYPTKNAAYDTLDETAGLCATCHGTDIDNLDYYTGTSLWRSGTVNGHSNSTVGGTGANKRNIFSASRTADYMSNQGNVGRTQQNDGNNSPQHFSSGQPQIEIFNTGWYGGTGGSSTQGTDFSSWYNTSTTTTTTAAIGQDPNLGVNNKAHNFTCSACHTPHASGLPVLLIMNCVDQYQSNYQNSVRTAANPSARGATNCHRKEDTNSTTTGWHRLNRGQ